MRPIWHVDHLFESDPPLLEFVTRPLIPSCVNQLIPPYIIFRVEVQRSDSRCVVRSSEKLHCVRTSEQVF